MDYQEQREAYATEIYSRTVRIIETRSEELVKDIYFDQDLCKRLETATSVIAMCHSEASSRLACQDIMEIMHQAAQRIAEQEYKKEMDRIAEELAMRRHEAICRKYNCHLRAA